MKQVHRLILVMAILAASTASPLKNAMALEIGAGPMVWYSWWHPVFEDVIRGTNVKNANEIKNSFNSSYHMDPSFLVGGAFTARGTAWGTRWSVYTTFLWGGWYHATGGYYTLPISGNINLWSEDYKIRKYDFDCNASYSFTSYFKIFLGAKVQGYDIRKNQIHYNLITGDIGGFIRNLHQLGAGPGIGVGFTLPVGGDFFVLWNLSALYMRAWFLTPGTNNDPRALYRYYNLYGGNTTLSLAYVVPGVDVTLTLGFRYQYLYYQYDARATADSLQGAPRDKNNDQFYGISFTAVYNFTVF